MDKAEAAALGRKLLIGGRFAYGLTAIVAPRPMVRVLMLRPDATPDHGQDYIVRLFGTRETFFAAMQAGLAGSGKSTAAAFRLGMAVDAVDLVSLFLARRNGRANPGALIAYTVIGLGLVGAAYLALEAEVN